MCQYVFKSVGNVKGLIWRRTCHVGRCTSMSLFYDSVQDMFTLRRWLSQHLANPILLCFHGLYIMPDCIQKSFQIFLRHSLYDLHRTPRESEASRINKTSTLDFQRVDFGIFERFIWAVPWKTVLRNKRVQRRMDILQERNSWSLRSQLSLCAKRWAGEDDDQPGLSGSSEKLREKKRVYQL